ncbi:MAG: AAA-like domain-containing protein [Gammaproteobacteria bacterium]|nr:AAA-like domain-containing protein [Gammaproteobacteria bacterium]
MAGDSTDQTTPTERDELDSSGQFFIVGPPLHAVRAGYVRRKADDQLCEALLAGQYVHVLAPNNSGKTSLVAAAAARMESSGSKVAILDLEQIGLRDGGTDPGRWYYNIAYRLMRQLRVRYDLQSWWQDKSILSNRQRLFEFYSEIILQFVPERVVIFVDELQCIEDLPFAAELLVSVRAAHNARTTDPDFSRLSFVLLGECDAMSLAEDPQLSPFSITQQVILADFTRAELGLFGTELALDKDSAAAALDRIYYWTRGQPYLTQKLARAVARESIEGDIGKAVDRVVRRQLSGRTAIRNEPHMGHIHRQVVSDKARYEQLLNLYGGIRKGMEVAADLGSPLHRRLIAIGLLEIDDDGALCVRNRLYARVFTARWANENLPVRLRVPAVVLGALLLLTLIPLWYTQWLPRPYVDILTSTSVGLESAASAHQNLRSFPGHADMADDMFRGFLEQRALAANDETEIAAVAELATELPEAGRLPESLQADFWDQKALAAMAAEQRDEALIAALQSLVMATPARRQRAARLVGEDYPLLLATLPRRQDARTVFDSESMVVTSLNGAQVSQWSYAKQALNRREDWTISALEVTPLVRRVIVDREGQVRRIGLKLTISHARLSDLRIKLIAPSGRTAEVKIGSGRSSSGDEIRIAPQQLRGLVGESLAGTWSVSVRDESPGVAGQLVGWNLNLNAQGSVEEFQRGLNIPEPVERETDNVWIDPNGRYAIARATQSDSVRIWDLALAEPLRAVSVTESEVLIGLDAGVRHLVTATQDSVNLWDILSGDKAASIPIGAAGGDVRITGDGKHLFVERRSDVETRLEFWSLSERALKSEVIVAGTPFLVAIDATGTRVAAADYDRAIRVWDMATGALQGQVDLPVQPSEIALAPGGSNLGVIYGSGGVSLWRIGEPMHNLHEDFGDGPWQLAFSRSGESVLIGQPGRGFQVHAASDGELIGPLLGMRSDAAQHDLLAFSHDEQVVVTGNRGGVLRFWKAPALPAAQANAGNQEHRVWSPSGDSVVAALPGAEKIAIGDRAGHVHIMAAGSTAAEINSISDDVSFLGHNAAVRLLSANDDGTLIASAATDNSVRVWDTQTGQPRSWKVDLAGSQVSRLELSPDSALLAVLGNGDVRLIDVETGEIIAQVALADAHRAMAFASSSELYLGAENGSLALLRADTSSGTWTLRRLWQGEAAIRWLEASPLGELLVLVDERNLASQFVLRDGRVSEATLQLPSTVRGVSFAGSGTRIMFRTARWVHRASASVTGLQLIDSVFIHKAVPGARIVAGRTDDGQLAANRAYLPVLRNGFLELTELGFDRPSGVGLFGDRDELLDEWRWKLFATRPAAAP